MNPGYIYKPPPPPPIPKPPPPEGGERHPQFPSQRGGRGGRGNGPGGAGYRGGAGGRGGGPGGGGGGAGRGRAGGFGGFGGFGGHGAQQQHHPLPPQRQHISTSISDNTPSLVWLQPPNSHQYYNNNPTTLALKEIPNPSFQPTPSRTNSSPLRLPSQTTPTSNSNHLPTPINHTHKNLPTQHTAAPPPPPPPPPPTWPAQPSYGHYHPPLPRPQYGGGGYHPHNQRGGGRGGGFGPPNKRQKRGGDEHGWASKPDMDHETWMKLNGGKILGTDISLDTPEDVAEWIRARKARWPTAQRIKEKEGERKKREDDAKKRAAEGGNAEKTKEELEAAEIRRKEKKEKNLKKKQRSKEKKAREAAERKEKGKEKEAKEGEGKQEVQVADGSKKRKREDEEEEVDVYKMQYASDSYPEDGGDKTVDQERGMEGEELDGVEVFVVQREDGRAGGDASTPKSSRLAASESEGGVSAGLIVLEKILSASSTEPATTKPLLDKHGDPITDDRLIDYDSQASDYEGGDGQVKENEEMVDNEEDGDVDETSSFSADMSLASDDYDSDTDSDSADDSSDSDSGSDTEEISSKALSGNLPPLPTNTDLNTQPSLKKENGKKKMPCKSFQITGKCKYGDNCRNSHTIPSAKDREGGTGGEERISLHERMMRQQRERENEVVVRAVRWLFESRVLEKPADAGDIEKEMREEEKRREEGNRRGGNRRGGGGFNGRRGGRGGQVGKLASGRGRFKRRGGGRGSGV
ncbi:hypothetical protein EV426DRAFT_661226 [Tirmania nivea]|nr:hypothetical protein EV426DRAFT_661226 [Tirmania nivea]